MAHRLPPEIDIEGMGTEFLSKTLDERLDEIAPKAVRESRRATCRHEQFDLTYLFCRHCGMTPFERYSKPEQGN
jgi:hypothetical protein